MAYNLYSIQGNKCMSYRPTIFFTFDLLLYSKYMDVQCLVLMSVKKYSCRMALQSAVSQSRILYRCIRQSFI